MNKGNVVSFLPVVGFTLGCVVIAYLMVPREEVLMDRLLDDGKSSRVLDLVEAEEPSSEKNRGRVSSSFIDELKRLERTASNLSPGALAKLTESLVKRALADERPDLAVDVYQIYSRHSPLSVEQAADLLRVCRYSEKVSHGIAILEKQDMDSPGMEAALMAMYRENGDAESAFDLARKLIVEPDAKDMSHLVDLGLEAGKEQELIPYLEAFVAPMKVASMPLEEVKAGHSDPDYRKYGEILAQFSLWNDRFDSAFDHYARLAIMGHPDAIEHCLNLYDGLRREIDMSKVLVQLCPIDGRPECSLILGRLLVEQGMFTGAKKCYQQVLQRDPDDFEILLEYGFLLQENNQHGEAITTLKKALALEKSDPKIARRVSQLLVSEERFSEALDIYRNFPVNALSQAAAEDYAMLADSLDDAKSKLVALKWLATQKNAQPESWLSWAHAAKNAGKRAELAKILHDANRKFPNDIDVRKRYAEFLGEQGKHGDAYQLVADKAFRKDPEMLANAVHYGVEAGKEAEVYRHVGKGIEDRHTFDTDTQIMIANMYEKLGQVEQAQNIYDGLPEGPQKWYALATQHFYENDFKRACTYQEKYLQAVPTSDFSEWEFLGDLYQRTGKVQKSDEAYDRALALIQQRQKQPVTVNQEP